MSRSLLLALLGLFLFACSTEDNLEPAEILGSWRATEVVQINLDDNATNRAIADALEDNFIAEGMVIHLFEDGTFGQVQAGNYQSGTWKFSAETGIITLGETGSRLRPKSREDDALQRNYLTAAFLLPDDTEVDLRWLNEGAPLPDASRDPFHPSLNQWRNTPIARESDAAIRARLVNYLRHYAAILYAADERDQRAVSFRGSQGIVRVYRGGIGRVPKDKISDAWIATYYDKTDAIRAYQLFSSYLSQGLYKGGGTGSWIKDDYRILRKIIQVMEQDGTAPLPEEKKNPETTLG